MKILKASAGSGKTYRLSHTYLEKLLSSERTDSYKHILAVTFTNKATAEMKARILRDLAREGKDNPRAREILIDILHGYSAFSISTIDKFFQQTLKSFSRETGHFADYQIELDRNSIIDEAIDRILDSLSEDKSELLDWFKSSMEQRLENGARYKAEEGLSDMGKLLKNEEFRQMSEAFGIETQEAFSKSRLKKLDSYCRKIISGFEKECTALGIEVPATGAVKKPGKRALAKASVELLSLFEKPWAAYKTALLIKKSLFQLGVAGEFHKAFSDILSEKNIMCLDESNLTLKQIIDGSDAPFIYEKIGTRYDHFLLDEFQDTSVIQWQNFLPLLKESDSKGGDSLIVGDVKQSIYRWRNSEWELLGRQVLEDFPEAGVEVLKHNWRSARNIVRFNNDFFARAAQILGLSEIYSDVHQEIPQKTVLDGNVRVSFCDDQIQAVLDSVRNALDHGARLSDIAVLVRKNSTGSMIAEKLIEAGYDVISDDSLSLKSSLTVRRLVSLLSSMNDPSDLVGSYLAQSMNLEFPKKYHSLTDLCEGFLRTLRNLDPEIYDGEVLFIQAFMDTIQDWAKLNGNNLKSFLESWARKEIYIGSPENSEAIRILTVHKSKGLEYPYVIFPFADKVELYKEDTHWCHLDASGNGLNPIMDGLYPIPLTKEASESLFKEYVDRERLNQKVDNLNLFYVALTRASCSLHVIARQPSKKCRESIAKGKPEYGNLSEILYQVCGAMDEYSLGETPDYSAPGRREEDSSTIPFEASFPSIPLDGRLKASDDSLDFFAEDGTVGIQASKRLKGIALHSILSNVITMDDLSRSVDQAVSQGIIPTEMAEDCRELLSARIASRQEWFTGNCLNEVPLFNSYGELKRPDRVVFGENGKVTVIDFKFGDEEESYRHQVLSYMKIYRDLGYCDVEGYLWYVTEDKVRKIE